MSEKPKVYFTKVISPEKLIEVYEKLNIKLEGNIAVKVHSGEKGNKNFIKPEFIKPIVDYLNATIVETNTSGPDEVVSTMVPSKRSTIGFMNSGLMKF